LTLPSRFHLHSSIWGENMAAVGRQSLHVKVPEFYGD
jgi:hypothetical protein